MIRTSLLLIVALLGVAASAAAQPGPSPGYDDPLVYAHDYFVDQVDAASGDPVAYAQQKANQGALTAEAAHGAYMACWTAHHYGEALPPGCEQFYEPPQDGAPLPADPEPSPVEEPADEVQDAATEFADEAAAAVEAIVADPTSTPSHLERLRDATFRFVDRVASALADFGAGVVATVQAIVDGAATGIGAVGFAVGAGGAALSDAGEATGYAVQEAASLSHDRFVAGVEGATRTYGAAASTVSDAVREAVDDAISSVREAWRSLFDARSGTTDSKLPDAPATFETVDGLLGTATDLLE